jgi:hypothetical protein
MDFRDPTTIPLPATDEAFERLCMLIARNSYGAEYYRYAVKGQAQYGIDIYAADQFERYLQCKLHKRDISDADLVRELESDLKKAQTKFPNIRHFIFAVSVHTRPALQDACKKMSNGQLTVTPWFWNKLQEDVASSKWLLRYYLDNTAGAQWISNDFEWQQKEKGEQEDWKPIDFYSSNSFVQWYGIIKKWDAPRQHFSNICTTIAASFADKYSDMPVAAIVSGDGGTGKSVLLRRIAMELRNEYTVYWIADNAIDFLDNEWEEDIEKHDDEKYLLVLEDWYRNFTKTGSSETAVRLLQKVKRKPNVRLLIGDRPATPGNYPKPKNALFDLKHKENADLLKYIITQIPEWEGKFSEEQQTQLLETGLFQLLFVYQYSMATEVLPKAGDYFLEIIQSDYNQLCKSENVFYKGLANTLYIYANLYAEYTLYLSPEAIILLAEYFSAAKRPFALEQNSDALLKDPVIKKYFDIIIKKNAEYEHPLFKFRHDTLADEGWKNVQTDQRERYDSFNTVLQLLQVLKTGATINDLSSIINRTALFRNPAITKEQILPLVDYLIDNRAANSSFAMALFIDGSLQVTEPEQAIYLEKLTGAYNNNDYLWMHIVKHHISKKTEPMQLETYRKLVEAGNTCDCILVRFYERMSLLELKQKVKTDFTTERLLAPKFSRGMSIFLKRLEDDTEVRLVIRDFLGTKNAHVSLGSFTGCLNITHEEDFAIKAAVDYLDTDEPWTVKENFTTSLFVAKEDPIAEKRATDYLRLPEPHRDKENFTTCLQLLIDKPIAKEKAADFIQVPDAEKKVEIYSIALKVLHEDAIDIVTVILLSQVKQNDPRIVYRALMIAADLPQLHAYAADMVTQIINAYPGYFDKSREDDIHLYIQMLKVPLFDIDVWQDEVDDLLYHYKNTHRNIFYSLTLSHRDWPEPLADACLYYIRNWRVEFSRPKKHWAYLVRSLACPEIQEEPALRNEVRNLCTQMFEAPNCPVKLLKWLRRISEDDWFPEWTRAGEDEE